MPRQGRLHIPGSLYHVIARGINRCKIFLDAKDYRNFLDRLSGILTKNQCKCYAWAFMPNHFHLLLKPGTISISTILSKQLTGYALFFNHRHKRYGKLFQNRFKSILCQKETYLLELIRYIHLNPVRAGIIKSFQELDRAPITGHRGLINRQGYAWQLREEVLGLFGRTRGKALTGYYRYLQEGWSQGHRRELSGGGLIRSIGGWRNIETMEKAKERWPSDERILGDGDFVREIEKTHTMAIESRERFKRQGWTLQRLVENICRDYQIRDSSELRKRGRKNNLSNAKSLIACWAYEILGIPSAELVSLFAVTNMGLSKMIRRGAQIAKEKGLRFPGL